MHPKAIGNKILVRPNPPEQSPGGLILPKNFQKQKVAQTIGTVVSAGRGVTEVKEGDTVLFYTVSGTEIKEYYNLSIDSCLAILEYTDAND